MLSFVKFSSEIESGRVYRREEGCDALISDLTRNGLGARHRHSDLCNRAVLIHGLGKMKASEGPDPHSVGLSLFFSQPPDAGVHTSWCRSA
jgi:hypothetical protein